MFYCWFFSSFPAELSKCTFCVAGCVLNINSTHFGDFLEIFKFPMVLSLKLLGSFWSNTYIHFLVIMILLHCTCDERKLCLKVKKSTNVFSKIVIQICWIGCWCSFILFWTGNTLFEQSWSKKLKLFV